MYACFRLPRYVGAPTRRVLAGARARARGLGTEFAVTLAGHTHRFTLGAALVHVTTHGMHHRAQCLNMLRHLGVPGVSDRLPEIDPLDWQLNANA